MARKNLMTNKSIKTHKTTAGFYKYSYTRKIPLKINPRIPEIKGLIERDFRFLG
jgi:hypothetical protein